MLIRRGNRAPQKPSASTSPGHGPKPGKNGDTDLIYGAMVASRDNAGQQRTGNFRLSRESRGSYDQDLGSRRPSLDKLPPPAMVRTKINSKEAACERESFEVISTTRVPKAMLGISPPTTASSLDSDNSDPGPQGAERSGASSTRTSSSSNGHSAGSRAARGGERAQSADDAAAGRKGGKASRRTDLKAKPFAGRPVGKKAKRPPPSRPHSWTPGDQGAVLQSTESLGGEERAGPTPAKVAGGTAPASGARREFQRGGSAGQGARPGGLRKGPSAFSSQVGSGSLVGDEKPVPPPTILPGVTFAAEVETVEIEPRKSRAASGRGRSMGTWFAWGDRKDAGKTDPGSGPGAEAGAEAGRSVELGKRPGRGKGGGAGGAPPGSRKWYWRPPRRKAPVPISARRISSFARTDAWVKELLGERLREAAKEAQEAGDPEGQLGGFYQRRRAEGGGGARGQNAAAMGVPPPAGRPWRAFDARLAERPQEAGWGFNCIHRQPDQPPLTADILLCVLFKIVVSCFCWGTVRLVEFLKETSIAGWLAGWLVA